MQRRGPCVHQQNLQASASASAASSSSPQPPAPKRNLAAAACLRLYEEGQEFLAYKKQLYIKFGLQKVPIKKATMGSITVPTKKLETNATAKSSKLALKSGVNQESRSSIAALKRTSVQGIGPKQTAVSPSKERRSSSVYVPPGGRSPTSTLKPVLAKTYSLQSTMESRAAVAPQKKPNTNRKPSSPKNNSAKRETGTIRAKHSVSSTSVNTAKNASLGAPQVVPSQPNQHSRASTTGSLESTRASRASMVSPNSGRRPSTTPLQSSRTYSTIFQQQQRRQDPVLVQVSRRTSSPIMSPIGRRRPSVSPIGPACNGVSDTASSFEPPGAGCSPRASFIRRDNKLEKLQEQVNVLKASLGISEEDLLWKVESSKGNAFIAADRHLAACEERYDRLAFEMQELSQPARCVDEDKANVLLAAKLKALEKQAQQVAELKARATHYQADLIQTKKNLMAARVEAELQRAKQAVGGFVLTAEQELALTRRLESIKEGILTVQQQLITEQGSLQTLLEWLGSETDRFGASVAAEDLSPSFVISEQTLEAKRSLLYTLQTIPECTQGSERLSSLCTQATQLAARITASRAHDLKHTETELERTMRDVEIWKTRREQAKEFADEMRKREAEWQKKQHEENDESLALMRTFVPIDIADLSVETLITRAQEGGVLYTYDLATYLKTNRFLHWLVTHEDDIARANFLAIESASFFMDFANYDINELRALARVLPDTFAFDKDGRKNTWRTNFIGHVRQLAAQQQHETIKAGWDPVKRSRREVPLPELTAKQQLNPIFCYPSDAEIDTRLVKFERQRARIESKRVRFKKLDDELIPQAKAEYVAVAEDARNEDLQRSFGKSTLIALREQAKQQHLALCKDRDTVRGELAHGERAWAAMTPSFEQYQAEVAQIRALEPEIRNAFRITGPFPADIDVQPRERAAFKKLSVEEEAEARKRELDNAIAKRSLDISEVVAEEPSAPAEPIVNVSVVQVSLLTQAELEATRLMQLEGKTSMVDPESKVVSDVPAEAAPLRGFKRVKSLQVAVGVLQFLENDFCSPKRVISGKEGGLPSPFKKAASSGSVQTERVEKNGEQVVGTPRGPRPLPPTPKATKEGNTKIVKPPVVVQPKSKALLKLVEARKAEETGNSPKTQESAPPPSPFGGGKVNFLGELQNRFPRKPSESDSEQTNTIPGARKPVNFLDELKRKAGAGDASSDASPKKPMTFLDELKNASARKTAVSPEDNEAVRP
ncbi:hypothetical protein PC129_g3481 [Phytophthora cactorum]|uniref:Uncharacterized protein n=1 Tax=Phytophthora cactorum TaxID=29920 RepID=A0A329SK14_9STRA|nr:hypothetical protein Pcac1_g21470 [Phytophthora cactorum]KAG2825746.1 hypothetical protein PC112_g9576 [Phytophthora cactorum]KAG2827984.1 hypothetical protein PC111_g8371 [Phytophthora cactorum]KAG2866009.1 hypothetical protein PC113_g3212 [Phytophthora cactorum]KAG2921231.1 hypothetical protein PC114_g5757 [Phytophthora cactorum]